MERNINFANQELRELITKEVEKAGEDFEAEIAGTNQALSEHAESQTATNLWSQNDSKQIWAEISEL
jgi:hypothetical protein